MILAVAKGMIEVGQAQWDWFLRRKLSKIEFGNGVAYYDKDSQMVGQALNGKFYVKVNPAIKA
jgi:hypothetical protein